MSRRFLLCVLLIWLLVASNPLAAEEKPRVDRYGDPLPEHALARLGTTRFVHGRLILCLAYSPDGKVLASGGEDKTIILWDAMSGRRIRLLEGHSKRVYQLLFSRDSKLLLSKGLGPSTDDDLRLWNVDTGKVLFQLSETNDSICAIALSPDGKSVVTGHRSNQVSFWDIGTGKRSRCWTCGNPDQAVYQLAFEPDSKRLVTAENGGKIRFWDWTSGKELPGDLKLPGVVTGLAFSPDKTILAASDQLGISLYRASTLDLLHRLRGHKGGVSSISFSPDGKTLFSSGEEDSVRIWDVASGKQRRKIVTKRGWILTFAVSPDGKTVAIPGGFGSIIVERWNAQTGVVESPTSRHVGEVEQVSFLSDGETVASEVGQEVVLWPHGLGKEPRPVQAPLGSETYLLCPDHSTVAVTTKAGQVYLLDIASGKEILRVSIAKKLWAEAISADNNRAAFQVGFDHVEVWDLINKKALYRSDGKSHCRGMSADGQLIALKLDTSICVWNLGTNKELCRIEIPDSIFPSVAFSPDGRMIVDSTSRVWEIATGKERLKLQGHLGEVKAFDFSPDRRTLTTGGVDKTVRLFDLRNGKELQVFNGHLGPVWAVAFSPDGQRLVSGSHDTTALVWAIPAGFWDRKPEALKLERDERIKLWGNLALEDQAAVAYTAQQRLASSPAEAVELCRSLLLAKSTPPDQIERWIAKLDDDDFTVREQASQDLGRVGGEAEPALERALKGDCSPEMHRRIKSLLESQKDKQMSIRVLRAVELLEQIGTPEAVEVLRQLEKKTGDAAIREDVRRSLDRLQAKQKTR